MRHISIIILLVLCMTLLLSTGCMKNTVKPETAGPVNEPVIPAGPVNEPVIEDPNTVYPQKWATGTGTASDPWANSCLESAVAACPAGGTIFLKAGYYQLANSLELAKSISIVGEDMNNTIIKTANKNGILVRADNCTLKGFTIDGDAQTDGKEFLSPIDISNCDYALFEDIEIKNAGYYGFNIYQVNHSLFQNIHSHDNYRHGLHPGSDTAGRNKYNIYRDIYAWNNGACGFKDRGIYNSPLEECFNLFDGLNCWDNGTYGIEIAFQKGGVLLNSSASGNGKSGIRLLGIEDFNLHDCSTTFSGEEGLYIQNSDNIHLTKIIVKNNNTLNGANTSGIMIDNSSNIELTSCQSYDDRTPMLQKYGMRTFGTVGFVEIINCILIPNEISSILNSAGAVITITTKKKLATL